MKSTLPRYSDKAILSESGRDSDIALSKFHEALERPRSPAVRGAVARQLKGLQHNPAPMRALCNLLRTAPA